MTQEEVSKLKLPSLNSLFAIRANLQTLSLKINTLIDCEGININYIETKSLEIDWVILQLANQTSHYKNSKEPYEISNLKETAWTLLEKLEAYCSTKLGVSIW